MSTKQLIEESRRWLGIINAHKLNEYKKLEDPVGVSAGNVDTLLTWLENGEAVEARAGFQLMRENPVIVNNGGFKGAELIVAMTGALAALQFGAVAHGLHALQEPLALFIGGDMHHFRADGAAVRFIKRGDDVAQFERRTLRGE